ncbi:MAG: glycoside hydrolase family 38 C-terminal domain-containing protein [Planctomycetota bacterium]
MRPDSEVFRPRFEMLCREVLAPAIWPRSEPLAVSEWETEERFAIGAARAAAGGGAFRAVTVPHRWGPAWSTRWFRLEGSPSGEIRAASDRAGQRLRIRFDAGTEATVWSAAGDPIRGLDEHRDAFELPGPGPVDVLIEAACNHPFGDQVFDWDSRERGERWRSGTPGLVTRAEVAVFDETVWRLHTRMLFAAGLLGELDSRSVRAQDLYAGLARAADAIDDTDVAGCARAVLGMVDRLLQREAGGSAPDLICVAHAHIDTAWLWPIAETRRKVVRSWTNTLELMEIDPDLHFVCSQPQQYAWLERDAPAVFGRVQRAVSEGHFQPIGSMWVEPDTLLPSGESLIRQVLVGSRYFHDRFPDAPPQRIVFLPDTFGFPACLPTVMHACGLHTFITNKIHWNQTNRFPHTSFRWRGPDGSEVLAHNTPGGDYNASVTPGELRRATDRIVGRDEAGLDGAPVALQPFGFGDGGGGPTHEMVERVRAASNCEGLPKARLASVHEFVRALHEEDQRAGGLPVWSGPIDLELHRGTLTSQRWLKQANARAERGLRTAELLDTIGQHDADRTRGLRDAWERTLLNQFHDILPGSSIGPVYEDARRDHARIAECIDAVESSSLGDGASVRILNTASCERTGVVSIDGQLAGVRAAGFGLAEPERIELQPVEIRDGVVSNGLVSFALDDCGRIRSLHAAGGPELAADGPLHQLRLYRDRPMNWDAWDIDLDYERQLVWTNDSSASIEVVLETPQRIEVRAGFSVGESPCVQTFRLDAGSPMVEVNTEIDWRASHRLLRVESVPRIRSEHVTVGTQFGHITRPTHRNTSWDRAGFEFACHGWMDLAEPGRGLAIIADAIHGRSAHGSTMGLSLLRAPSHPDPVADRGEHVLRVAYLPHAGDWRSADVDHHAECFSEPLRLVRSEISHHPVSIGVSDGGCVAVAAFKRSEDNPASRVLRLVEPRGTQARVSVRFADPVSCVRRADALERPYPHGEVVRGSTVELDMRPFEIVTLLAEP